MVVAVIALLLSILLPSLAAAREAARASGCQSNLRQAMVACRMYADQHRGASPALGQPYASLPNWGLVVQRYAAGNRAGGERFAAESVLVCPASQLRYPEVMTRTYAINVTGHAGAAGDADSYDVAGAPAHIRMDRVRRPADEVMLLDASRAPIVGDAPPPVRTASVIDFRVSEHVEQRIGRVHRREKALQAAAFDGSVGAYFEPREFWKEGLP